MRIVALAVLIFVSGCRKDGAQRPGDQRKHRESYSLGYQTGQGLKSRDVEIDVDVYLSGLRDALAGRKGAIGDEEMRAALQGVRTQLLGAQQARARDRAAQNLAQSRAFLAENRKKDGVRILASGLQYRVLAEGTGKVPATTDSVTVRYRGTFPDGSEFASSDRQSKPSNVALAKVIPGWREALLLMKTGARWQLVVPPELAYGARGTAGIEPNRALIFDLQLLAVGPAAPPAARM